MANQPVNRLIIKEMLPYSYMLGAKYGFAQFMDCNVQTMDPYFVWAIHGLRVHVYTSQFLIYI